jgi:hypothetical protein
MGGNYEGLIVKCEIAPFVGPAPSPGGFFKRDQEPLSLTHSPRSVGGAREPNWTRRLPWGHIAKVRGSGAPLRRYFYWGSGSGRGGAWVRLRDTHGAPVCRDVPALTLPSPKGRGSPPSSFRHGAGRALQSHLACREIAPPLIANDRPQPNVSLDGQNGQTSVGLVVTGEGFGVTRKNQGRG